MLESECSKISPQLIVTNKALVNIQPISGKPKVGTDGITLKCKMVIVCVYVVPVKLLIKSEWDNRIDRIFTIYRIIIFFWMLFGLSFFGSLISLMSRSMNRFLVNY